jgi:hypothetical protein
VYALAVTMYRCMTGVIPHESIERVVKDTLQRPTRLGIALSPLQEAALLKGMAVSAKNRFQDMQKFMDALYGAPGISFSQGGIKPAEPARLTTEKTVAEPVKIKNEKDAAREAAEKKAEEIGFFNRLFGGKKKK